MKEVPVQVRFAHPPPDGYQIVAQQVIPDVLQVAGPEPRVDATDMAQTDAIDLGAVTKYAEIRVNTYVADPQVWLQSLPMVTVKLTVEKSGK